MTNCRQAHGLPFLKREPKTGHNPHLSLRAFLSLALERIEVRVESRVEVLTGAVALQCCTLL